MLDNSGIWIACGLLCIYPLISAGIGIALYRRWQTGGGITWRKNHD